MIKSYFFTQVLSCFKLHCQITIINNQNLPEFLKKNMDANGFTRDQKHTGSIQNDEYDEDNMKMLGKTVTPVTNTNMKNNRWSSNTEQMAYKKNTM